MNIVASGKKHQGSVLLVALLTAWVIGIALVSYLTLIANQNRSTYRSLSWNTCIPVLEAGIEEALTQIHYAGNTANFGANQWTYNATDDLGRYRLDLHAQSNRSQPGEILRLFMPAESKAARTSAHLRGGITERAG